MDYVQNGVLYHHGILGQKWGIRRYQNKDGSLTKSGKKRYNNSKQSIDDIIRAGAKTRNLEKWGTSKDLNVLYITGYSGSGKSTVAQTLAQKQDTIIHLDGYSESQNVSIQNKAFNKYLDQNIPNWRNIAYDKNGEHGDDYWSLVDEFASAIDNFAKLEYAKGNKVICEGIQIADGWLRSDKNYYASKPVILLNTSAITSLLRASKRDNVSIRKASSKVKNYISMHNTLKDFQSAADVSSAKNFVEKYRYR